MEISADKRIIKELNKIEEAEVVKTPKNGVKVTRITAKSSKRGHSRKRK